MEKGYHMHKSLISTLALAVLLVGSVAGVSFARAAYENVIQCPDSTPGDGYCDGTNRDDLMKGTPKDDHMRAWRGVDVMYGYGGTDELSGSYGPDVVYGGPGGDDLYSECEAREYGCGKDEKHGGPGDDFFSGSLSSERYFGGRGDDQIADYGSPDNPDYIRCGPGLDNVIYNKGIDKVASDCEELQPWKP